jgi:hypothetical protein
LAVRLIKLETTPNNNTMLYKNLALFGVLVLLPLASGQFKPLRHAGPDCGDEFSPVRNGGSVLKKGGPTARNAGRSFPPRKRTRHGGPHDAKGGPPIPPPHRGLRQRRMQDAPESTPDKPEDSTPRFDCGQSPLVKQETGCPCFNLTAITSQMDLTSASTYCDLYASAPVPEDDQCAYLYPPAYGSFYASSYTDTDDFSMSFGYDGHYAPEEKGGFCYGDIYSWVYDYDDNDYGDYIGESHGFSLGAEVTETELKECEKVFEELKKNFGDNCWIEIGSGYYY